MEMYEEMTRRELECMKESKEHYEAMLDMAGKCKDFGSYLEGRIDEVKARIFNLEKRLDMYGSLKEV